MSAAFESKVSLKPFNLFCSTCHYFLSEKGVMMQMLAKPSSICFSTDERPQNISLQDEVPKMPGMCDCKVHDFACGCGARLGYHLLSPVIIVKRKAPNSAGSCALAALKQNLVTHLTHHTRLARHVGLM